MEMFLLWIGRLAGVVGVLITGVAIATRLSGNYALGGFQVGTVLMAGMAAMIVACLCLLAVLTNRPAR